MTATTAEVPHPHLTTPDDNGRLWAFRAVHPDLRSSRGYVWPFPGKVAKAAGPFDLDNKGGCPSAPGDGICLGLTLAGVASGGIPAIAVLVCSYLPADLLGTEGNGSKIRVKKCRVERLVDFPAMLRGAVDLDALLPTANLDGANLYRANLYRANLYGANLYGADLRGANLDGANLDGANLDGANLRGAYLDGANLDGANLYRANLYGANLYGANLYRANLYRANLYGADLRGANLRGANLDGAEGNAYTRLPAGYSVSPEGSIVWGGAS